MNNPQPVVSLFNREIGGDRFATDCAHHHTVSLETTAKPRVVGGEPERGRQRLRASGAKAEPIAEELEKNDRRRNVIGNSDPGVDTLTCAGRHEILHKEIWIRLRQLSANPVNKLSACHAGLLPSWHLGSHHRDLGNPHNPIQSNRSALKGLYSIKYNPLKYRGFGIACRWAKVSHIKGLSLIESRP